MSYILKDNYNNSDIYVSLNVNDEISEFVNTLNRNNKYKIIKSFYFLNDDYNFSDDINCIIRKLKNNNSYVLKVYKNNYIWIIEYYKLFSIDNGIIGCIVGKEPIIEITIIYLTINKLKMD